MTTPDLSFIIPSKAKAYVGLVGSALSFIVPYVLEVTDSLPAPWPAIVGVVLFLLSALGVYRAPYKPPGTVLAPDTAAVSTASADAGAVDYDASPRNPDEPGEYQNPWRR